MAFDETLTQDVLKHANIVNVVKAFLEVTKKGKNYFAKCPFHDDNNPSLVISEEKQIFRCFVCGTSGNAVTFVRKYLNIPYFDALKKVAELSDYHDPRLEGVVKAKPVDPRRDPLIKCLKDLTLYYEFALNTEEGKIGLKYFEDRHLDAQIREKYHLGYALKDGKATVKFLEQKGHSLKTIEDIGIASIHNGESSDRNQGRVIFPICNADGEVVGFSARRLVESQESKYINSPETYVFNKSSILYNYHIAKEKARSAGYIYITEGFMDVFALGKIGIDAAVATMGTALTKEHIHLLKMLNVEVRLCLDGDLPGQKAMMEISKTLSQAGVNYRIVDNQGSSKDPDEILNQDGPDALRAYLNNLISKVDFTLNFYGKTNPLQTIEQKKGLVKEFIPILLATKSSLELDSYIIKLARATGFEVDSIRNLLGRVRVAEKNSGNTDKVIREYHPERKVLRKLENAEREMLYQMLHKKEAIEFYEEKTDGFYTPMYRHIADFLLNYAQEHEKLVPDEMISSLEESNYDGKDELVSDLTELMMENTHPNHLDDKFLNDLLNTMNDERNKIFNDDMLKSSLEGKDPLEQARILAEFNKRKMKKTGGN